METFGSFNFWRVGSLVSFLYYHTFTNWARGTGGGGGRQAEAGEALGVLTGLDLERQPDKGKRCLLRWELPPSEADPGQADTWLPHRGPGTAASCSGDSWSRRSPGSCSAHCCQPAASLLPDPWACWWEWHNYLIPAQGDLGHMQTDGGPGGFSTV